MGCNFRADENGIFRLILSSASGKTWEWAIDGLESEDPIYIDDMQGTAR